MREQELNFRVLRSCQDLYKFFIPLFEKKIKSIIDERETKIEEIKRIANKNDTIINLKEIAERQIKSYENNNQHPQKYQNQAQIKRRKVLL